MNLDVNDLRVAATVVSLAVFLAICVWASMRRHRARFDDAAHLPFDGDR